jgi:hypothetical protein
MRFLFLATRLAVPAFALALFVGGVMHSFGFSGGRF